MEGGGLELWSPPNVQDCLQNGPSSTHSWRQSVGLFGTSCAHPWQTPPGEPSQKNSAAVAGGLLRGNLPSLGPKGCLGGRGLDQGFRQKKWKLPVRFGQEDQPNGKGQSLGISVEVFSTLLSTSWTPAVQENKVCSYENSPCRVPPGQVRWGQGQASLVSGTKAGPHAVTHTVPAANHKQLGRCEAR